MKVKATLTVDRLSTFLADWQSIPDHQPLSLQLAAFLDSYRAVAPARTEKVPPSLPLDPDKLDAALAALRLPLAKARDAGAVVNPWTAARLGRNEVRNAAALGTLVDARVMGKAGRDFLIALLGELAPAPHLPTVSDLDQGYRVRREHCAGDGNGDRIDLTIEGQGFVLGIEIKIDAGDQPDQLDRYVSACRQWAGGSRKCAVIYLARWCPRKDGEVRDDIPHLLWSVVGKAARRVAQQAPATSGLFNYQLLAAYARHLKQEGIYE